MPAQANPTIAINDYIRTQLRTVNINSASARTLHDRWIAVDQQGFPFTDSYRVITASSRNTLFMKLRENLAPRVILSTETISPAHGFSVSAYNPQNPSESRWNTTTVSSRYIDGLALRVGPADQYGQRGYVPFMFERPWEIPVVPRPTVTTGTGRNDWYARRRQEKAYQKHINTCNLAANGILEEMIRLGTIRVGLVRDVLLNQAEAEPVYNTEYLNDR